MSNPCPRCNSVMGIREIIYGLPAEPVDETKYAIGGCCISDTDPTIRCIECGWEGEYKNNLPYGDKTIQVAGLKPLVNMTGAEIDDYAKQLWNKLTNGRKGSSDGHSNG